MNAGLGDSVGKLRFTSDQDTTNHVLAEGEDANFVSVQVSTLDELCGERIPAMIKVDVEGFEHAVVAGGKRTLEDPDLQTVIMETNSSGLRYGWEDAQLVQTMRDLGFSTCSYDPLRRRLEAAPAGADNSLFVRDIAAMQARLAGAPKFRLLNGEI